MASRPVRADPGDLLWTFDTAGPVFASPTLRPDGTIYVGSNDSKLYAITAGLAEGVEKWSFDAGDWIDSSVALGSDGTVYVGTYDSKLLALNPDTGALKWELSIGEVGGEFGVIQSSPAILADGSIAITTSAGFVHRVSASGEEMWSYEIGADSRSSIAVDTQGNLYFGADDGVVYCLNDSGEELWTYAVDGAGEEDEASRLYSSPAIDGNGHLYIGSGNGNLYSLTSGGTLRWTFATAEAVDVSPAIDVDNQIYFASRSGNAYCVDSQGDEVWSQFLGDIFYSSPILDSQGFVYFTYFGGQNRTFVTALAAGGQQVWQTQIDAVVDSSLSLSIDGTLYLGAFDGKIYAIEGNGTAIASSYPWAKFRCDLRGRGRVLGGALPEVPEVIEPALTSVGASAELRLESDEADLSYIWRKDKVVISSASSPSLVIPQVGRDDVSMYDVIVSNGVGERLLTETFLALFEPPQVLAENGSPTFQVTLTYPLSEDWEFSVLQSTDAMTWTTEGIETEVVDLESTKASQQVMVSVPVVTSQGYVRLQSDPK